MVAGTVTVCGLLWFFTRPADYVDAVFKWMHPGAVALAVVAPIGTLIAVGTASILAYRTLRYRTRVDDADQWWKRAQYGIDLVHGTPAQKAAGSNLITSLLGPWLKTVDAETPAKNIRKAHKRARSYGWRAPEEEKEMLNRILQSALEGMVADSLTDKEHERLEVNEQGGSSTRAAQLNNLEAGHAPKDEPTTQDAISEPQHRSGRRMSGGEEYTDVAEEEG